MGDGEKVGRDGPIRAADLDTPLKALAGSRVSLRVLASQSSDTSTSTSTQGLAISNTSADCSFEGSNREPTSSSVPSRAVAARARIRVSPCGPPPRFCCVQGRFFDMQQHVPDVFQKPYSVRRERLGAASSMDQGWWMVNYLQPDQASPFARNRASTQGSKKVCLELWYWLCPRIHESRSSSWSAGRTNHGRHATMSPWELLPKLPARYSKQYGAIYDCQSHPTIFQPLPKRAELTLSGACPSLNPVSVCPCTSASNPPPSFPLPLPPPVNQSKKYRNSGPGGMQLGYSDRQCKA